MPAILELLKNRLGEIPTWRKALYLSVAVLSVAYLIWCRFGSTPIPAGQTVTAQPVAKIEAMPKKIVSVPLVVIRDKEKAAQILNIPNEQKPTSREELFQANKVPKLPNGGTVTTFVNISSGQGRTVIQANARPWFSFERGNTLGARVDLSSKDGQVYSAYYRRDILQVKGAFLTANLEANSRPEGKAGIALEYRW